MESIVKIKDLSKSYFNKKALDNINLDIEEGKIIGILGPNGSGKTTLLKIISGILRQSKGEIFIEGQKPGPYTKSVVSYLPDRNYLYKWMKIKDAIEFFKDFYKDFDEKRADELLDFMKLDKEMKLTSLSKGMVEKLNLTLVLSRKAKLYVLDEPIAGVDPVARDKILDSIINSYDENSSMIVTTHLVRDIEKIFNRVIFLKSGKIELSGDVEELREKNQSSIDELYKKVFEE
ncbi:ABC transporter ATP-binding protein [Acidilutibacter cellobiosedens]|jgi:ABC-2 type transport system ATP-binding protein|uniref:ABC transporter ATP-binding protein n=1 Tax=Acidilutibacter cellobiosedens TaxID=2507161 RepID=A0A410QA46_9FIRM|nr:ABC transporter ATP-binding protein [Acidilutibacter cellobiosedens]QAT60865.1 ABC transporter ATP-binding protein [Acidilutibacter cellobiosedens]